MQGVAGALPSGAPVAVAAGATLDTGGFATSLGGLSGAGNLTGTGAVTVDAATDATFSGAISGTGLSLTKSGIGTLTLSGANSYDGTTTVTGGVLSVSASNNLGAATNALALAGGTLAITNHLQTSRSLTVSGANSAVDVQAVGASALSPSGLTLDSGVTFNSQLQKLGAGILRLNAAGSGAGGIAVTAGTLTLNDNQAAGTGALALAAGTTLTTETVGTLTLANAVSLTGAGQRLVAGPTGAGSSLVLGGAISGAGGLKLTGGTLRLNGANSFSGGVEATAGSLIIGNSLALGSGPLTLGGGAGLTAAVDGLRLANAIDVGGLHSLRVNAGLTLTLDGAITGTGMIRHDVGGVLRLNAANSFSGGLTVVDGTVEAGASSSLGTGTLFLHTTGAGTPALRAGASSVTLANRIELNNLRAPVIDTQANTLTLTGVIANGQTVGGGAESASLVKSGSGTLILNGVNTYTGATSVNAGKLVVNGSIASSSGLTIAQGASLGGNGSVPRLTVNGTIAPGNSVGVLRVNGGLTLSSTAVTAIEIEGNAADRIEVTGSAILNGTLQLIAAGTPYSFSTPYTILTTTGARGGTFATVTTTGSFGVGVTSDVIYGSNAVQVTLTAAPLAPIVTNPAASAAPVAGGSAVASATAGSVPGTRNVVAVARGLDNARNAGANLSSLFPIYNQPTAAALQTALNTVSGEVHTASMAIGQRASDQFLRVMLDPSALGRDGSLLAGTAGETGNAPAPLFRRSYQVWGASFGGVDRVGGERRTVGSTEREIRDLNLAVGADFLVAPGTIAGFALSGGQSRAKLGEGLGSSEGNIFQAGLYGSSRLGALELGASAAYSAIATETSRLIPALGLNARADYTLSVWGGRLQGAYEIWNGNGLTLSPVAAVQAQSVQMPSFVERTSLTGAVAGLAGQNQTRTTLRTELGLRVSQKLSLGGYKAALSGQIAWGHYALREAEFTASVAGVAGSAFTITGARPARDVMLLSTGLDLELAPNITFGSRFDLNAGQNTRSYAGSAVLRASF
ncbi:autotransporter outer membrane beta-barrel domain-containing protein [Bosea sp. (in: a-proteobacteria)]|uniref:autotransporter outer membrane beta-barrel domain-containing protein n=1 Tax=Bosea sp. (in: a-proteobacteria) TaxID=1871050 RepID=UPI003B3AE8DE